ncbi:MULTISPECIES: RNA polymerase sigma factor [Nonlabens]|uniref:RNA polymerase subunit sigma n=1 Tax=Nonlabens agnitus TaxID=870484 RepID=A0A2S9WSD1_9FLAO|nr:MULTISPECIES: RNA polymerase sigma factor [Nonlabens]KQC33517.1 DNA-directed RNA polymerase subunit sigma [Nonlabens sp. YIK11]PRP66393.1 RNA polymerase subunit sigma [Nonlabens agnitus]
MNLTELKNDVFDLCEKGDRRAQMQVYNDYAKGMYHVALRIVEDTAQAEDIMQESMITAFSKIHQWNREATFGSWLKRIVINNCLNYKRKAGRMTTTTFEDHHDAVDDTENIDMEHAGWTAKRVLAAMKELKDSYREVLTLSLIEGMDNEEIAQIMGISHGMCRTTISRAKTSLRSKMELI